MAIIIDHCKVEETLSMHQAIIKNDLIEVKRLLSQGAAVNLGDEFDRTALHVAAKENIDDSHYSIIEELLKNGADVNAQDKIGYTPLHLLVGRAKSKTVQLLLDFDADTEIKCVFGRVPLMRAVFGSSNGVDVPKLLVENGASVNVRDNNGETPLHFLCGGLDITDRVVEKAKYLLENRANIEALDVENCTPLVHLLSRSHSQYVFKFFFKYACFSSVEFFPRSVNHMHSFLSDSIWNILLAHIAKLIALEFTMHPSFFQEVLKKLELKVYFNKCTEELILAKSTKLKGCWVTFFNLLVDSKRKLKNYAGNRDLIDDFIKSDYLKKFPIYGAEIQKNVEKAVQRRKFFDDSAVNLSDCLPVFNPNHLVIRDLLDCLTFKDYNVFISKQ